MQFLGLISLMVVMLLGAWYVVTTSPVTAPTEPVPVEEQTLDPVITAEIDAHADLITVTSPQPNDVVTTPLTITGQARGQWFFEASFPVVLVDWDGKIIAESYASAEGDWMTADFVPFTATVDFETPYHDGDPDFMRHGALILKKDNPSGLPEHDDALEFPVVFGQAAAKTGYGGAINAAKDAAHMLEQPQ
ncbi:Gmad2 immunoglobulin-like domain-containing protein [Candidatus Kaiserbacteria bacterium]|nr:Gmad2 immunoglobulin-like domain-containing protein [Candidatus Kaiserbacteria bacterium]